ncbi:UNVERIFIED_CONTAM: hypothetical protein GTU68_027638 [Idotea baltica]|nr:hypothetical protein [Idotea baltica]
MKVPSVGESVTEVTIASWVKQDGDYVEMDEIICELESDKATFELPAEAAGILRIVAQEEETLEIGALVCKIEASAEATSSPAPTEAPKVEESAAPAAAPAASGSGEIIEVTVPSVGESITEVTLSAGVIKIIAEEGAVIPVGDLVAKITAGAGASSAAPTPAASSPAASTTSAAAPAVSEGERGQRREKMTSLRKTIAKRLVSVKNETAMLTTFNEVDMKPIMDLRKSYKEKFKDIHGIGLGFMSFFTKACSIALQEFPTINAYIDGNEIVFNDFTDISIAVSAPKGLVVPVIRNAEKLSFAGIESEVMRLALKARDGKLTLPEMTGGTFTITNGGIFGSMLSTPIINAPQSAILGMHNIVERPVAINGQVEIRPIMYLALSYDHRTIDGKESVSFLVRLKQLLEDPMRMMLQV